MRKVPLHTQICTSCFLVRIISVLCSQNIRLVSEDVWVPILPVIEECPKFFFGAYGQLQHDCTECFASRCFRSSREVLRHGAHLVELAYLYRYSLKYLEHISFSVNNDCLEYPATLLKYLPSIVVRRHNFSYHTSPPNVSFQVWCSEYTDTPRSSKEGGVDNEDDGLWCNEFLFYPHFCKLRTNPFHTPTLPFC